MKKYSNIDFFSFGENEKQGKHDNFRLLKLMISVHKRH